MADMSDAKPAITADVPIPPKGLQENPHVFSGGVSLVSIFNMMASIFNMMAQC